MTSTNLHYFTQITSALTPTPKLAVSLLLPGSISIPLPVDFLPTEETEDFKKLTRKDRDLIYQETRNSNMCEKSAKLFNYFFALCPKDQDLSIQINKEPPVLVKASSREPKIWSFHGPKLFTTYFWLEGEAVQMHSTGKTDGADHVILEFANPQDAQDPYVVDISRIQYGEAGRGRYGEIYFLDKRSEWYVSNKKICDIGYPKDHVIEDSDEPWLKECAERVWK